MKYCKDCKHFERYPGNGKESVIMYSTCNRQNTIVQDPVIGKRKIFKDEYAFYEREKDDRCGPDAKYFERKKWLFIF
jgi:hypothetical protein